MYLSTLSKYMYLYLKINIQLVLVHVLKYIVKVHVLVLEDLYNPI